MDLKGVFDCSLVIALLYSKMERCCWSMWVSQMHCMLTAHEECVCGHLTQSFGTCSSVKQGCSTPFLVMGQVMHDSVDGVEYGGFEAVIGGRLCGLQYASDSVSFRYRILLWRESQELSLHSVCTWHLQSMMWCAGTGTLKPPLTLNGFLLDVIDRFTHLGSCEQWWWYCLGS